MAEWNDEIPRNWGQHFNSTSYSRTLDALLHPFSISSGNHHYCDIPYPHWSSSVAEPFKKENHQEILAHHPQSPLFDTWIADHILSEEEDADAHGISLTNHLIERLVESQDLLHSHDDLGPTDSFCTSRDTPSSQRNNTTLPLRPKSESSNSRTTSSDKPINEAKASWDPVDTGESVTNVVKTSAEPHFTNEHFAIARSQTAGWGAFAAKDLYRGEVILREKPLFIANSSNLYREFDKLDKQAQRVAFSLHANEMVKAGTPPLQAVWDTNCFAVGRKEAGLFPVAARFNHACHPAQTVDFHYEHQEGMLVLSVRADKIARGDELKITYGRDRTVAELYMTYGFRCRCGACPGLTDEEASRLTSLW